MSRYYRETWNGLGTLGATKCEWWDAGCHTKKALDSAGDVVDTATGGGWSKSKKAREAAAELIGIKSPDTSISRGGVKPPTKEKEAPADDYPTVEAAKDLLSPPVVIGGVVVLGLIGYLIMGRKKK